MYSGMWNMCGGVITEATGGIMDVCRKRFRDAQSKGLKGGDGWGWGESMNGRKAARLVDGPIVIGEFQNTRQAGKCSDMFVHLSGMWSRWGEGKLDSRPGAGEEVVEDWA